MEGKKFYWLKLKKDFFKRHDIKIIERMPGGDQVVLFYLKLMLESVDHNGRLRFNEEIPYTTEMLASITDTDLETAEKAMKVLMQLCLVKIDDDQTIIIEKVASMIGFETEWARQKKEWREQKRQGEDTSRTTEGQCPDNVQTMSDKSKSQIKSKSQSKDIFLSAAGEKKFTPPTIEEVVDFCESRHNGINPQLFFDYYEARGWCLGGEQIRDWKALLRTWENNNSSLQKIKNEYN